jgi:LPXTG-motif cell wall-anchored protein
VKKVIEKLQDIGFETQSFEPDFEAPSILPRTGSKELSWIILLLVMIMGGYVVTRSSKR